MKETVKAAVIGSFVGDSMALGVHWVYNTDAIEQKYGRVEGMLQPELTTYHAGKNKGDFTHYGDQMMLLLTSIAENASFDPARFADRWRNFFDHYNGYVDHASKDTLTNFSAGMPKEKSGSSSSDLAGAARIAPLIACYHDDMDAMIQSAREQTCMTHNHPTVIAAAELFARTAHMVLQGLSPVAALSEAAKASPRSGEMGDLIQTGLDSRDTDTRQAISNFGQMCAVEAALPSIIHLIVKYQDNFSEAIIENIMAGGDSAARGMLVGFILGCYHGMSGIPDRWISEMIQTKKILQLVDNIIR